MGCGGTKGGEKEVSRWSEEEEAWEKEEQRDKKGLPSLSSGLVAALGWSCPVPVQGSLSCLLIKLHCQLFPGSRALSLVRARVRVCLGL